MLQRCARHLVAFLCPFLLGAPLALAQSTALSGVVVDESGGAVAAARVSAATPSGTLSGVTDGNGRFVLSGAPAGRLHLVVEKPLFARTEVDVDAADNVAEVRVVLALADVRETVTVSSPIVDAVSADAYGSARTIVSSEQITSLNAVDLASALRRTPGVTISRFNPVGAFGGTEGGAVYVRGLGASRPGSELKSYVDGVPFYMAVWGHPLLDLLPVNAMDRITVFKGPQPQTYGNTFSAIDIATKRARTEGTTATVRLQGGSFSTVVEQADLTGRHGAWDYTVAQGFARSDGHRESADGRLANGLARVGRQLNEHWSVAGMGMYLNNTAADPGVDGKPATRSGRYDTNGALGAVTLTHRFDRVSGSLVAYANRGEGNWLAQTGLDGDTLSSFALSGLRWTEELTPWRNGRVSAGLDVDRIGGEVAFNRVAPAPSASFTGETLTVTAPHVGLEQTIPAGRTWSFVPSAGVRLYRHSALESMAAPHAGLVARSSMLELRVNASRGVTYPGQEVLVLSSLIPPLGTTWKNLKPEVLDHVEVGASFAPAAGTSIDVAWFRDALKDRYIFAFPPAVAFPQFTNLGNYDVRGAELSVRQSLGAWSVFGGLTLLDPSLASLPYAPTRSFVMGLTGGHGPFRLSVDAQAQSEMRVFGQERAGGATNAEQVDGFVVVNARPSWAPAAFGGRGELFVALENLFNADYAYRPGYPMPGTSVQVGVSLGKLLK